jgi:hypothetical protein
MTTDQHTAETGAHARPTSEDPDVMRRDVDATRAELSRDVDALTEKITPSKVIGRRVGRVRSAAGSAKEKVMGSSIASSASSTTTDTLASTRRTTEGNPLAAGLIAFGVGWLVSSTIPAARPEREAAAALKTQAEEHSDTLTAPLKDAAGEAAEQMSESAKHAAEAVKEKATEAAGEVRQQTGSSG